jgi:predicted nucleic acid-binding protein
MTVLFDTNVIIDICEERQPFYHASFQVYNLVAEKQITGLISASALTDVYYIARKFFQSHEAAFETIEKIIAIVDMADTLAQDIRDAMSLPMGDFEDAVIATVAKREGVDYIVTRNTEDFAASPVSAITPENFLTLQIP